MDSLFGSRSFANKFVVAPSNFLACYRAVGDSLASAALLERDIGLFTVGARSDADDLGLRRRLGFERRMAMTVVVVVVASWAMFVMMVVIMVMIMIVVMIVIASWAVFMMVAVRMAM